MAIAVSLPLLVAAAPSSAQDGSSSPSAPGGPGTRGGAATSRAQIGAPSTAGVVNPNANGTGLGVAPGSTDTLLNQNLDQNRTSSTARARCPTGTVGSTTTASSAVSSDPAGALARSTGSQPAGQTPLPDVTGSVGSNCTTQP